MPILSEKGKIGISINNNLQKLDGIHKFRKENYHGFISILLFDEFSPSTGTKDYEFETSSSTKKVQSLIEGHVRSNSNLVS